MAAETAHHSYEESRKVMSNESRRPSSDPALSSTVKINPHMTITQYYHTVEDRLEQAVHFEELDTEEARIALDAGADVNAKTSEGSPPLESAAYGNNVRLIRLLLERGADVNACTSYGDTALMSAAQYDSARVTAVLLAHGASLEARNNDGMAALHCAVAHDSSHAIRVLVNAGANIEARDNEGRTPLLLAAYCSRLRAMRAFIKNGADANARSNNGYSALDWHRQPPPYFNMTESQYLEYIYQDSIYQWKSNNLLDHVCHVYFRIREALFGIPEDDYLAIQKMLENASVKKK